MYKDRVMSETKKIKRVFTPEFKERAVRMVVEIREVPGEGYGAITRVSNQLGISKGSLRNWIAEDEANKAIRSGLSDNERDELVRLKRELKEMKRANEILKAAAGFFGAELDRLHK